MVSFFKMNKSYPIEQHLSSICIDFDLQPPIDLRDKKDPTGWGDLSGLIQFVGRSGGGNLAKKSS